MATTQQHEDFAEAQIAANLALLTRIGKLVEEATSGSQISREVRDLAVAYAVLNGKLASVSG